MTGSDRPRFSEVTPGNATVPPGDRLWSAGQRRIGRLAGYGAGWLAVTALDRLVAALDPPTPHVCQSCDQPLPPAAAC